MAHYRSFRDLDWPLIIIALAICSIGVLQIYSATHETPVWQDAWWKQIIYIGMGLVLLWVTTKIDYHTLLGQVPILYLGTIVTLIGTFLVGKMVFGSRRWIGFAGFHFQVSEFAKLVIVLLVARYLAELKSEQLEGRDLLKLGGLVGLPLLLVMRQPDLGTSLTYVPILAAGCFWLVCGGSTSPSCWWRLRLPCRSDGTSSGSIRKIVWSASGTRLAIRRGRDTR